MIGALYFHLRKIPRGVFQQYFKLNLHVHIIKQCHNIHELSWVIIQCTKHKMRSCSYCPSVLTIAINRCSVSRCCCASTVVMAVAAYLPSIAMAEASSPILCYAACSFKVLSALPPISLFLSCLLPTSIACSRITDKTNCQVSKAELKMQRKISSIQQRDPINL